MDYQGLRGITGDLGRESRILPVGRDRAAHRIVIFQDTLERDFGSDPDLLARQVDRTLRHEVAHHLGYGEPGVAALGL